VSTRVGLIIVWLLAIDLLQHLDRGTILEYSHKLLVDLGLLTCVIIHYICLSID
jgi:hypothetical protein